MRAMILTALACTAGGCASHAAVSPVRFHNQPPVGVVDDRHDVAKPPPGGEPMLWAYYYDGFFQRRISRAMEVRRHQRALGVNALDEVPDSTWFTNRIGVRDLTPDEIRRGPETAGSPEAHGPFTIHSQKSAGTSLGFVVTDARGERFLMKFDLRGIPETETAAEVIVGRLLWAAGYNVPETHVIYLRRDDLRIADDATIKDAVGKKRRLTVRDVDAGLRTIEQDPDGRIRAMTSRMLDGKPLGGHPGEGTRAGDPNDRIRHELRRDLRGAYPLFAWVDHVDVKEHNTLDMWVTDPADPACHYVKHYQLDFGKSLGMMMLSSRDPRRGHEYFIDANILASLVTAGLYQRSWESRDVPPLRGVGAFDARTFHPGTWKPTGPMYTPLVQADRFDKFWGARLVARFTREQLRAAVEAGRLTDPRAVDYLVDTLVARQRATARYWFGKVNPLAGFALTTDAAGTSLCFDDLLLTYRLLPVAGDTRYTVTSHDRQGRPVGTPRQLTAQPNGHTCTPALALAGDGDGYTILRVATARPTFRGATDVHVARDPRTRALRVIGIWRP